MQAVAELRDRLSLMDEMKKPEPETQIAPLSAKFDPEYLKRQLGQVHHFDTERVAALLAETGPDGDRPSLSELADQLGIDLDKSAQTHAWDQLAVEPVSYPEAERAGEDPSPEL
jgi:hypothetical protein